jgi:glycosyltransferase involved in cell wall biosynthesis
VRVLYFSRGYTSHDHRFLAALGETGHEVSFLRLEPGVPGEESRPVPPKVRVVGWPGGERPWRWSEVPGRRAELRHVVAEIQPDLVHAGPVQRGALLTALAGFRPLVTMSWGSDLLLEARGGLGRWAARYALARSAALICDCQTVRLAAQELGMPEERIIVSPWGVDLRHFSPGEDGGLRSRLGWESSFVLLSTRSWERIYGVEVLAEAFIRAARVEPSLRLLALSGGSLRPQIEGMLSRAGLADRDIRQLDIPKLFNS